MITRRSLFLGAAAVITTPGLLMPVRKLATVPGWFMAALEEEFRRRQADSVWLAANPPMFVHSDWKLMKSEPGAVRQGRIVLLDSLVIKPT